MARCTDISKYEISDFTPSWIEQSFPNSEEFADVFDVIKFYLINSPCLRSSSRGTDVTIWGKPSLVLLNRIKNEIGLVKGSNYDYGKSKISMKGLFMKYSLTTDFTHINKDMIVFLDDGNVFGNIFKHIRNSIAHSRWQKQDNWFYFEDGSDENINGNTYFCVTARIILCEESLIKLRDLICNGPNDQELEEINLEAKLDDLLQRLIQRFHDRRFTRNEAVQYLSIDNSLWKKLYAKGKKSGVLKMKNQKWEIS